MKCITATCYRTGVAHIKGFHDDKVLVGVILDLFIYLSGLSKPSDLYHLAPEAIDDVVEGVLQMCMVKMAEDSKYGLVQQICPHCGMKVDTLCILFCFKCVVCRYII